MKSGRPSVFLFFYGKLPNRLHRLCEIFVQIVGPLTFLGSFWSNQATSLWSPSSSSNCWRLHWDEIDIPNSNNESDDEWTFCIPIIPTSNWSVKTAFFFPHGGSDHAFHKISIKNCDHLLFDVFLGFLLGTICFKHWSLSTLTQTRSLEPVNHLEWRHTKVLEPENRNKQGYWSLTMNLIDYKDQ